MGLFKSKEKKKGFESLINPKLNKSTAFSEEEKEKLGLTGLVPDIIETIQQQQVRILAQLQHKNTDLERYIYLMNLLDHNETLYYHVVMSDPKRFFRSFTIQRSQKHV